MPLLKKCLGSRGLLVAVASLVALAALVVPAANAQPSPPETHDCPGPALAVIATAEPARPTGRIWRPWTRYMRSPLLAVHVFAGSIALASMMVPLVAAKGGPVHRRFGWIFVTTMTIVSVTAFLLAAARLTGGQSPSSRGIVAVLLFASMVTLAAVWAGVRVLRVRRRARPHRDVWGLTVAAGVLLASGAMAAFGLLAGLPLVWLFSSVGFFVGGGQLAYWLKPPAHPKHWWFQHMTSMLGACIAAVTAFLVVNAEQFGATTFAVGVWLAPTVVGVPVTVFWTRYYRRRFTAAEAPALPR